jgi:hypothetical protein
MRVIRHHGPAPRPAWVVAAALVVAFLVAGCTSAPAFPIHRPGAPQGGRVIALDSMSTLRSLFNHDQGRTRLLLILSPT